MKDIMQILKKKIFSRAVSITASDMMLLRSIVGAIFNKNALIACFIVPLLKPCEATAM